MSLISLGTQQLSRKFTIIFSLDTRLPADETITRIVNIRFSCVNIRKTSIIHVYTGSPQLATVYFSTVHNTRGLKTKGQKYKETKNF
jgi:hypothetical protein